MELRTVMRQRQFEQSLSSELRAFEFNGVKAGTQELPLLARPRARHPRQLASHLLSHCSSLLMTWRQAPMIAHTYNHHQCQVNQWGRTPRGAISMQTKTRRRNISRAEPLAALV